MRRRLVNPVRVDPGRLRPPVTLYVHLSDQALTTGPRLSAPAPGPTPSGPPAPPTSPTDTDTSPTDQQESFTPAA